MDCTDTRTAPSPDCTGRSPSSSVLWRPCGFCTLGRGSVCCHIPVASLQRKGHQTRVARPFRECRAVCIYTWRSVYEMQPPYSMLHRHDPLMCHSVAPLSAVTQRTPWHGQCPRRDRHSISLTCMPSRVAITGTQKSRVRNGCTQRAAATTAIRRDPRVPPPLYSISMDNRWAGGHT